MIDKDLTIAILIHCVLSYSSVLLFLWWVLCVSLTSFLYSDIIIFFLYVSFIGIPIGLSKGCHKTSYSYNNVFYAINNFHHLQKPLKFYFPHMPYIIAVIIISYVYQIFLVIVIDCFFKKRFCLFIFREKERNINVWEVHHLVASHIPSTGQLAHNPGMCPDWELNWQPFSSQANN